MNGSTSLLSGLSVASPCAVSWDSMSGDDRRRFCGRCNLNVYNLSEMSRAQAEALIIRSEGRLCARFYRRADGTVITQDCPVGLRAVRRKLALLAGALATALIGLGTWASMLRRPSAGVRSSQSTSMANLPWREVEPFATWIEWIDPAPPPSSISTWSGSPMTMGKISMDPGPRHSP